MNENEHIFKLMLKWMEKNKAKATWFTADEWANELEMQITPQRLTSMVKSGLLERCRDRRYYGDNNYRYNPIK